MGLAVICELLDRDGRKRWTLVTQESIPEIVPHIAIDLPGMTIRQRAVRSRHGNRKSH